MGLDIRAFRSTLKNRLAELDRLDAAGEDERAVVVLDQQAIGRLARMDLLQRQQIAKETHRMRSLDRAKVKAALARIDEDEFGWCANCGEPIGRERLNVDPTTPRCIGCAT